MVLSSGCILDRLWETHRQFYAKEPQIVFQRKPSGETQLLFHKPTLLEKDVTWLAGQEPTRTETIQNERWTEYVLVQEGRTTRPAPLRGRLRFEWREDEYRLAEVVLPQIVDLMVTPEMITAAIETLRYPAPELLRRRLKIDLHSFQKLRLPGRREVERLVGRPNRVSSDRQTVAYRFFLLKADGTLPEPDKAIDVTLRYDEQGKIRAGEGGYSRYKVRVDMEAAEAILWVQ